MTEQRDRDDGGPAGSSRDDLISALESMLRVTANPDPIHPSWGHARNKAIAALAKARKGDSQ